MKTIISLSIIIFFITTTNIHAALPTGSDFEQLDRNICGLGVPPVGYFTKKPVFTLVGSNTTFKLKGDKEYYFPSCLTGCRVDSWHMYFKTPITNLSDFQFLLFQTFSRGSNFTAYTGRTASTTFNARGMAIVTAASQFDPDRDPYFETCDASYVYIQSQPTVGEISMINTTTGIPSAGIRTFTASNGAMDNSYSKFAQQRKPLTYKWSARNIDLGWSTSATTTTPSADLDLRYGGEYIITVRTFDGTYHSTKKSKYIFVNGSTCINGQCYDLR